MTTESFAFVKMAAIPSLSEIFSKLLVAFHTNFGNVRYLEQGYHYFVFIEFLFVRVPMQFL